MVDWITDTLVDINTRVLERTSIYFHPSVDQGQISVITQDGLTVSIDAAQKFSVKVYVSAKTLADTQLCAAMKVSIVKAIKSELERSIVSMSNMTSEILALLSDHVFEVSVSGIADGQYSVVTTTSESDRLSLRKKLSALSDGTLVVENAVEVDFIALKTK
jgi:hypothetical protein